jgi:D-threo-aldose 1-dehydrogenase
MTASRRAGEGVETQQALTRVSLGATDVEVTRLGLGTAPLGGWPAAVTREQGTATVARAWDLGVRYFDTAPFYGSGHSEQMVGSVLASRPRNEFTLSTKVGRLLVPGAPEASLYEGGLPFTPVYDFSYDATLQSLSESRERLGLDRIDIALIHDPDEHHDAALAGSYRALVDLRTEGTIGAIGVGMNWSEPLARFAEEGDFDCFLVAGRYTLFEQHSLDDLLPLAVSRGISIIAGGIYNSGLLANPRPGTFYDYAPAPEELVQRAQRLEVVCNGFGVTLRAAALQFPLAHPAIACIVVGARTPAEMEENVRLLDVDIPRELWTSLKERGLVRRDAPTPGS